MQGSSSLPELKKQPTTKDFCAFVNMDESVTEIGHNASSPMTQTRVISINMDGSEAPVPVTLTWAEVGCALSTQYQHRQVSLMDESGLACHPLPLHHSHLVRPHLPQHAVRGAGTLAKFDNLKAHKCVHFMHASSAATTCHMRLAFHTMQCQHASADTPKMLTTTFPLLFSWPFHGSWRDSWMSVVQQNTMAHPKH